MAGTCNISVYGFPPEMARLYTFMFDSSNIVPMHWPSIAYSSIDEPIPMIERFSSCPMLSNAGLVIPYRPFLMKLPSINPLLTIVGKTDPARTRKTRKRAQREERKLATVTWLKGSSRIQFTHKLRYHALLCFQDLTKLDDLLHEFPNPLR